VRRAIASGRISQLAGGGIDPEVADREWARSTDPSKPRNSITGEPKRTRSREAPSEPAFGSTASGAERAERVGGRGGASYAESRAIRETYEAGIRRLEFGRLNGNLVEVAAVHAAVYALVSRARDQLQAIPARLAPILAGVSDPFELERLMDAEIRRVCEELSKPVELLPRESARNAGASA
jgi:hypothetical protein